MPAANLQSGCSSIVALLACFSTFHFILAHIYPLLSIVVSDTCFAPRYIMSWHWRGQRDTWSIIRTVIYCWIQILISSRLIRTLVVTLQECIGARIPMIPHVPIVELASLLRFLIVLFCGFPNCKLNPLFLKWKQRQLILLVFAKSFFLLFILLYF